MERMEIDRKKEKRRNGEEMLETCGNYKKSKHNNKNIHNGKRCGKLEHKGFKSEKVPSTVSTYLFISWKKKTIEQAIFLSRENNFHMQFNMANWQS